MKLLKIDKQNNSFEVVPESLDDLWHLERIIEQGDLVSGRSTRKIKPSREGEKTKRIDIFVEISVEEIDFHKFSGKTRVNGKIVSGKPQELIELKAYHSLDLELGKKVLVKKKKLKKYQIDRLKKAAASRKPKILLVALDDEQADFALVKESGLDHKTTIRSGKSGKQFKSEEFQNKFFAELLKKIEEIKAEKIIAAGPGFTKNSFQNYLKEKKPELKPLFKSINSVGVTGLNEIIKQGILEEVTAEVQIAKETNIIEELFAELAKEGKVVYGLKEAEKAIEAGAVEKLLVLDKILLEQRDLAEKLMEKTEELGGEIHIISAEHEAGKKLESISGIAAFLRYKI